jgi:hypothetical protein
MSYQVFVLNPKKVKSNSIIFTLNSSRVLKRVNLSAWQNFHDLFSSTHIWLNNYYMFKTCTLYGYKACSVCAMPNPPNYSQAAPPHFLWQFYLHHLGREI